MRLWLGSKKELLCVPNRFPYFRIREFESFHSIVTLYKWKHLRQNDLIICPSLKYMFTYSLQCFQSILK